jgi:succinyl-CoA synthetase alpha subunit
LTHAKIKKLQDHVARIRGGQDVWIPYWLKEVGTAEEIEEYRCIRRREIAELNRRPVVGTVAGRMQQVIDSEKRSREFERRMRAKYGSRMPETNSEALERDLPDPEIAREVQEAMKDERLLEQNRRRC